MSLRLSEPSISVQELTDPREIRPKEDQAIVIPIKRDISNLTYCDELNKHINDDKSFLFVARISGDRLSVVFKEAAQAEHLVNKVRHITVDGEQIPIKFQVAKAIKVIISNAGFGISNSALKKYINQTCKIRTASSVSELKAHVHPTGERFANACSYKRVVYIHPEDEHKLPKTPVKFNAGNIANYVFFDTDSPKCFLCASPDHFRKDCPVNSEISGKNQEVTQTVNKNNNSQFSGLPTDKDDFLRPGGLPTAPSSQASNPCPNRPSEANLANTSDSSASSSSQEQKSPTFAETLQGCGAGSQNTEVNKTENFNSSANTNKRALSDTSGENNTQEIFDSSVKWATPASDLSTTQGKKSRRSKKAKREGENEVKNVEDRLVEVAASLQPARSVIDASSEKHLLKFDDLVKILVQTFGLNPTERCNIVRSFTNNFLEVSGLVDDIYNLVSGNSIKAQLRSLKRSFSRDDDTQSQTDASMASDAE